jgi:hypothetical protein
MIKVLGSSPEKIELPELNDRIYYKQEKTFSEIDYKRSQSLRNAINLGKVIVLERTQVSKEYASSPVQEEVDIPVVDPVKLEPVPPSAGSGSLDRSIVDLLLDKLTSLESKLDNETSKIVVDSTPLDIILERLKILEAKVSGTSSPSDGDKQLFKMLESLEEKISQGRGGVSEDFLQRIENSIKNSGSEGSSLVVEVDPSVGMERYVPNVTIEDANSHINLKVRTVEQSDSLNSSIEALRRLKGKSK